MTNPILDILWCAATLGIGCVSGCDTPESEPEAEPPQPLPPKDEYDSFVESYVGMCGKAAAFFSHRPLCGVGKNPQSATGSTDASLYIPSLDEFKNSSFHIPPLPDADVLQAGVPQGMGGCLIDCSWTAKKYPFPIVTEQGTLQGNAFCEVRIEFSPTESEPVPIGIKNLSTPRAEQQFGCKMVDSLYEYTFGLELPQHY